MSRWTNLLIALTIASGVYVLGSESWSAAYRINLILHPIVGLAATALLIRYAARHLKDKLKSQIHVTWRGLAVFLLLPTVGIVVGEAVGSTRGWRWLPLVLAIALLARPLRDVLGFVAGRMRHVPSIVLGTAALVGWAIAIGSGAALVPFQRLPVAHDALILHRVVALAAGALYVAHVLFIQVYRAERRDAPGALEARRELRFAVAGVSACAVAVVALIAGENLVGPKPSRTLLGRIPGDGHPQAPSTPRSGLDAKAVATTKSCGLSGCHPTIVDDFELSNHLHSPATGHFQRTVALLESERGTPDTLVCAGCHYPLGVATEKSDYRAYATEPGFSCVSCHSIREVTLDDAPGRSSYLLDPPMDHLRMFVGERGDEAPSELALTLIRMNPIGHGRAFRPTILDENEMCLSCHHNEIHPTHDPGFERPKCTSCHMSPQGMLGRPGESRNHLFPASNTAVPFLLANATTSETLRQFLTGEKPLYVDNWGSAWELREKGNTGMHRALWLRMALDVMGDALPGNPVELRIRTTNVGIEHHFPAAPLDLIDVWLDVEVKDATGRVLLRSGALDERHRVDPDAHRMGGYVLDNSGQRLSRHRIWDVAEEHVERHIANGEPTVDTYAFTIPADVAPGEIELHARWNYRKITQEFIDWAYGGGEAAVPTMPVTAIGTLDARWPLGKSGSTVKPVAHPSPPAGAATLYESEVRGEPRHAG